MVTRTVAPTVLARQSSRQRSSGVIALRLLERGALHVLALIGAVLFGLPLYFALSTAVKESRQIFQYPIVWVPNPVVLRNFVDAWNSQPFNVYVVNTILITGLAMFGQVLSACLVAYGFARFRFGARNFLFTLLISTMLLPGHVLLVPQFLLYHKLGWVNTILPLTVHYYFGGGAFYIFLMRQFFLTLPLELDDAAKIDGAGPLRIFFRIILPLSIPALGTVAIFSFIQHWDSFLEPLIYLTDQSKFTLAVGLRHMQSFLEPGVGGQFRINWLMAASMLVATPPLILFIVLQRYFVQGIVMSGIKG